MLAGSYFDSVEDGPMTDDEGRKDHFFAYIASFEMAGEAEIELPMVYGANHEIECFSFWFTMKVLIFS